MAKKLQGYSVARQTRPIPCALDTKQLSQSELPQRSLGPHFVALIFKGHRKTKTSSSILTTC
jgi:hypothetical protein